MRTSQTKLRATVTSAGRERKNTISTSFLQSLFFIVDAELNFTQCKMYRQKNFLNNSPNLQFMAAQCPLGLMWTKEMALCLFF